MVWELISNKSVPGLDRVQAMLCMSMTSVHGMYNCHCRAGETAKEVREKEKWGDQIEREPGARERKD